MKKATGIVQIGSSLIGAFMLMFMQMFEMRMQVDTRGIRTTIAEQNATVLDNAINNDPLINQSLIATVKICGIALVAFAIITLVLSVMKFAANYVVSLKKITDSKLTIFAPLASVLLALIFMLSASDYAASKVGTNTLYIANAPTMTFYICLVMLLVTLAMDWLGSRKRSN